MRVAVIGAGSIGRRHISSLLTLGVPASHITVADTDPAAAASLCHEFSGIGASLSFTPGWIPAGEAVLICVPAVAHHSYVRAAISHRVPFFLEKPATLGRHELPEAEWNTDVPHLVACNMRFTDAWKRAKRQMASRDVWIRLRSLSDMGEWPGHTYGPPVFEFCHEFDLAIDALGPATIDAVDTFEDGVSVHLAHGPATSHVTLGWRHRRVRAWRWVSCHQFDETAWCEHTPTQHEIDQSYLAEMAHFLNVVSGDQRSVNRLAQAKAVVELCERVTRG